MTTTATQFETIIGLEVHLQLNTATKIFCGCANTFGEEPNTRVCPVCYGLPGSLPVLNRRALEKAIKVALALNCRINPRIKFDRKNYFYPDLPKGYQISQYDHPVGEHGFVTIRSSGELKRIGIIRAHLEEDAGKLIHDPEGGVSLVDFNRTGTPLMEIVSAPDIRSPEEAYDYLTMLRLILLYCGVSDCDMEKGSLRCDANISLRPVGQTSFGTKIEIKNLNSFKAVKAALAFEERRQADVLILGRPLSQETRLWDENTQTTRLMRTKEEAHDYRYFPEPDLVPFVIDEAFIEQIRASLPEFPLDKQARYQSEFGLSQDDAEVLTQHPETAAFFEKAVALQRVPAKKVCNWIIGPVLSLINERRRSLSNTPLSPEGLVRLVQLMDEGTLNNLRAKEILTLMFETGKDPDTLVEEKGYRQVNDASLLEALVDEVLAQRPDVVEQIRGGKDSAIGFFIGQVMKKTQGKANPKIVGELIKRRIVQ